VPAFAFAGHVPRAAPGETAGGLGFAPRRDLRPYVWAGKRLPLVQVWVRAPAAEILLPFAPGRAARAALPGTSIAAMTPSDTASGEIFRTKRCIPYPLLVGRPWGIDPGGRGLGGPEPRPRFAGRSVVYRHHALFEESSQAENQRSAIRAVSAHRYRRLMDLNSNVAKLRELAQQVHADAQAAQVLSAVDL
jgi:hypothetical protein